MPHTEKMIRDIQIPGEKPEIRRSKLVQTHISWVLIGDEFVYKIKKPVNFGFLDFSTPEKRRHYCFREVELNRRLAPDVYIGVLPVIEHNGTLSIIDGCLEAHQGDVQAHLGDVQAHLGDVQAHPGDVQAHPGDVQAHKGNVQAHKGNVHNEKEKGIVEYCVKMKRIPDDMLMRTRLMKELLTSKDIRKIGKKIAEFHQTADTSTKIDEFGTMDTVKFNTDENFEQTKEFIGRSITEEQFRDIKNWTDRFYSDNEELFNRRIASKKIRDCHGDLHMEHICLTDPISIIDCIEFNDRFRYSDTASDIGFLIMDMEYNHRKDLGDMLYEGYVEHSDEEDTSIFDLVLKFYKVYRAYVRGKVTSFQLNDGNISAGKKKMISTTAANYFKLAHTYVVEDQFPIQ